MKDEPMTDKQMKTILKMVKEIVKASESTEEAEKKIDDLLKDYDS